MSLCCCAVVRNLHANSVRHGEVITATLHTKQLQQLNSTHGTHTHRLIDEHDPKFAVKLIISIAQAGALKLMGK